MARTNTLTRNEARTHEGAPALAPHKPIDQLRRAVMTCLLWEDQFYESGVAIADRIKTLVAQCTTEEVEVLAIEARIDGKLRHAPLLLLAELARAGRCASAETIANVLQRADEPGELISLYWQGGKRKLPNQMKRGIAMAMQRFDAYQLAKYDRKVAIRLRDVLRLTHPKPRDEAQSEMWRKLIAGELESPDTWEVALSGGEDKRATWERLLDAGKLGYLALLRNLRNMDQAKVPTTKVDEALRARKGGAHRVLPFRFVAAAKAAPAHEPALDEAMLATLAQAEKLPGKTVIVVDVSGSMYGSKVSAKSDMDRALAASALGAIGRELCEDVRVYATAGSDARRIHKTELVPARRGMALVDAIHGLRRPLGGGGIFTKQVCDYLREKEGEVDRMIIITDEQDCGVGRGDSPLAAEPIGRENYMINVASYKNGVAYNGRWTAIQGWSESVFDFILRSEQVTQGDR